MNPQLFHAACSRREALQQLAGILGIAALSTLPFPAAAALSSHLSARISPRASFYGEDDALAEDEIKIEKLTDNVSVLFGVGGNIALLMGKGDTLQIDSGNPGTTPAVLKSIKEITEKPVTVLINTHWHGDHTGGNEDMAKQGSRIYAHDNVRKRLSTDQYIEAFDRKVPASPEIALPILTFDDKLTLHHNGEELHLHSIPPAHTDSDILIHFSNANVLHAGDLFFNGMYPFIDSSTGGWIGGMIVGADKLLTIVDEKTKIIPGHGPVGTRAQFKSYRDMLVTVQERITPLVKSGKSVEEVVAAKPLADLDDKWGKGFMKPEMFVKVVYGGIKKFGV